MELHQQIAEGVRDKLASVGGFPRLHVRSKTYRFKSDDLPMTLIERGEEMPGPNTFGGGVFWEYEIGVSFILFKGMSVEVNIDEAKTLRQRARQVLIPPHDSDELPLPGLPLVWDVSPVDVPEEMDPWIKAGYGSAMLGLVYRSHQNYRG